MSLVPAKGLFEAHLTVSNLERSIEFYRDLVGLEFAHRVPERHAAFFWIGGRGKTMLGLWSVHSSPLQLRLHIAFDVSLADCVGSVERLSSEGIVPRDGGGGARIVEPIVFCWMPAASVYFDDPDGHSLEYIAMLEGQPRPNWGRMSLSEWRTRTALSA